MVDRFLFQLDFNIWCNMGIVKAKMTNWEGDIKIAPEQQLDFEQIRSCRKNIKVEEAFDLAWKEAGEKVKEEFFNRGDKV